MYNFFYITLACSLQESVGDQVTPTVWNGYYFALILLSTQWLKSRSHDKQKKSQVLRLRVIYIDVQEKGFFSLRLI